MRFLRRFLVSVAVVTLAYIVLAIIIDPACEFWRQGSRPGSTIDVTRYQKLTLFDQFARGGKVNGLILGSSRVMSVPPDAFSRHGRIFNFGTSGANICDYLATYRYVRQKTGPPSYILLGVDLTAFSPASTRPSLELRATTPLFATIKNRYPMGVAEQLGRAKRIFSVEYGFQMLLTTLRPVYYRWTHQKYDEGIPLNTPDRGYQPDGTEHNYYKDRQIAKGKWDWNKEIDDRTIGYKGAFAMMDCVAPAAKADFEEFLTEAQRDHARVHLWITAFHPRSELFLRQTTAYPQRLDELKRYLKSLEPRYPIQITDSTDPALYGDGHANWYDALHLRPAGVKLLCNMLQRSDRGL